ncbi:hypothetical protein DFS33DRAFT_1234902, partial [Desarmillaria ectypa]
NVKPTTMTERPVALVTVSARGIGRAIALRLASDEFNVALNDITSQKENIEVLLVEIEELGKKSFICIADASKEDKVNAMVMRPFSGTLISATAEEWDHIFAVNVRRVFLYYKYAAIQMVKQGWGGRIIGANSVTGMNFGHLCRYSASKFVVRGLMQSVAAKLGPYQITTNAHAPGFIDTPITRSLFSEDFAKSVTIFSSSRQPFALKKIGQPKDLASLVSYLALPDSHFITGQSAGINESMC